MTCSNSAQLVLSSFHLNGLVVVSISRHQLVFADGAVVSADVAIRLHGGRVLESNAVFIAVFRPNELADRVAARQKRLGRHEDLNRYGINFL